MNRDKTISMKVNSQLYNKFIETLKSEYEYSTADKFEEYMKYYLKQKNIIAIRDYSYFYKDTVYKFVKKEK